MINPEDQLSETEYKAAMRMWSKTDWSGIRRTIALTCISLCVGATIAFIIWGFGFLYFPEYPDLPFRIVFGLWVLDLSRHVYLWIKGQLK